MWSQAQQHKSGVLNWKFNDKYLVTNTMWCQPQVEIIYFIDYILWEMKVSFIIMNKVHSWVTVKDYWSWRMNASIKRFSSSCVICRCSVNAKKWLTVMGFSNNLQSIMPMLIGLNIFLQPMNQSNRRKFVQDLILYYS